MKKFIFSLIIFSLLFSIVISLIGFRLERGKIFNNVFDQTRWNDFYSSRDSLDYIFVGSSHVYNSIIPSHIDSINNTSSFNLGSGLQSPITSFYIIKESIRKKKVKSIIFEVFPRILFNNDNFGNALINFEVIESVDIKTRLLFTGDNYSDILEAFLPAYRYNNYLTTFFRAAPLEEVLTINEGVITRYGGQGYLKAVKSSKYVYQTNFDSLSLDMSDISSKKIKSINNIVSLCKLNSINLILITAPQNPKYFNNIKNYESFHSLIDSIATKNKIRYIDGNYLNNNIGLTYKDYYDSGHMLHSGAVKFSTWLAQELKKYDKIKE